MHDVVKTLLTESKVRSSRGALGLAIGAVLALVIFVGGIKALQIRKMMSTPQNMPAVTVTSAPAKEEDWAPRLSAIGSVSAVQGAVVSAELGGTVSEIGFENGADAKKGDAL